MNMEATERRIIEAIKSASKLSLEVKDGNGQSFTLHLRPNKKLHHDIALAYQQTVMDADRKQRREFFASSIA